MIRRDDSEYEPHCRDCSVPLTAGNARRSRGHFVGLCRPCESNANRRRKGWKRVRTDGSRKYPVPVGQLHQTQPEDLMARGRPRLYGDERRVSISVRTPESLYERLKAVADDREVSLTQIMLAAANHYLDHLPPPSDPSGAISPPSP